MSWVDVVVLKKKELDLINKFNLLSRHGFYYKNDYWLNGEPQVGLTLKEKLIKIHKECIEIWCVYCSNIL